MTLQRLFDSTAVVSALRQRRFEAQIGDRIWWVHPQNGVAKLYSQDRQNHGEPMAIQIVGTEGGGTWIWAWGNPLNLTASEAVTTSRELRALGPELEVPELEMSHVAVDGLANAATFAAIAHAISGAAGYVLHRAGPLIAVLLVDAPEFRTADTIDFLEIVQTCGDLAAAGSPIASPIHVFTGALDTFGIPYELGHDTLDARAPDGQTMRLRFAGQEFTADIHVPPPA